MAKAIYEEKFRRYRVFSKYIDWGNWWMTESFDTEEEAKAKVEANMRSPFRPDFEIWKWEDSLNDKNNSDNKEDCSR